MGRAESWGSSGTREAVVVSPIGANAPGGLALFTLHRRAALAAPLRTTVAQDAPEIGKEAMSAMGGGCFCAHSGLFCGAVSTTGVVQLQHHSSDTPPAASVPRRTALGIRSCRRETGDDPALRW